MSWERNLKRSSDKMKINFSGLFELKAPMEKVFDFISDPKTIAPLVPDIEKLEIIDDKNFKGNLKIGIGPLKGSFEGKGVITELIRPNHGALILEGSSVVGKVKVIVNIDLSENGGVTQLKWNADAEMSGLITGMGESMLKSINQTETKKIFEKVKEKLEK